MIVTVKGQISDCTHPDGPGQKYFCPEGCCPDDLCEHKDQYIIVDCNKTCAHHKEHNT